MNEWQKQAWIPRNLLTYDERLLRRRTGSRVAAKPPPLPASAAPRSGSTGTACHTPSDRPVAAVAPSPWSERSIPAPGRAPAFAQPPAHITHQISTQFDQLSERYAKRVCTCAQPDALHLLSNVSLFTHKIWTRSAQPFTRSGKRGVHVRTCRGTPPQTYVKLLSNWFLFTHKIWTQSAQPFAISGKRNVHVRTCRCTPSQTCVKLLSNVCLFSYKIWTRPAQPFARSGKRGVHVRTCRCTPPQTCIKLLSNGSLFTHRIWTRSA